MRFRLEIFSLKNADQVKVFLLAKGVECESLDTDKFNVTNEMSEFINQVEKYSLAVHVSKSGNLKVLIYVPYQQWLIYTKLFRNLTRC